MSLDSRVEVLAEAVRRGFSQEQRHIISRHYILAIEEFSRYNYIPPKTNPAWMDVRDKAYAHAALKARVYMDKHVPEDTEKILAAYQARMKAEGSPTRYRE